MLIAVSTFAQIAERFGFALAVLVLLLGTIWLFGNDKTRDDFIREVLLQDVTKRPYVTIFFVVLLLNALLGLTNRIGHKRAESKEMRRLADEKSRLQERRLGVALHHTDGPPDVTPPPVTRKQEDRGCLRPPSRALPRSPGDSPLCSLSARSGHAGRTDFALRLVRKPLQEGRHGSARSVDRRNSSSGDPDRRGNLGTSRSRVVVSRRRGSRETYVRRIGATLREFEAARLELVSELGDNVEASGACGCLESSAKGSLDAHRPMERPTLLGQ